MNGLLPQPLERLWIPVELDGRHGSNRARNVSGRQISADNDLQAIQTWLAEFRDSPQTQRHYRKESERLLLWSIMERNKPLSGLTREDLTLYEDFLTDPQPRERWCGTVGSRYSEHWRPFRGPLSPSSRRTALLIINALFSYLVEAGYLVGNPLALMRKRGCGGDPRRPAIERYLEYPQWQALLDTVERMPTDTERQRQHYERSRFLLALLYLLGPRVSEIANQAMGSFVEVRGRWWWHVTGKGNRQGRVPVNQDMLEALQNYRRFLGMTPLPLPGDSQPLVMNLGGTTGITSNMIYRIIKVLVNRAAEQLASLDPYQAEKLRHASTHWFRHTSLTHQADAGIDLNYLQRNARHAKMDTTSLYLHAEESRWHEAMERHRFKKT